MKPPIVKLLLAEGSRLNDLIHRLQRSHLISNPVAVHLMCDEAAETIYELAHELDNPPKRSPKHG